MKMGVGKRTMTLFRPLFSKKKYYYIRIGILRPQKFRFMEPKKKRGGEKGSWGQKRKEVKKV